MQKCYTLRFKEFVLSHFEEIIQHCSIEEMAEFAFGNTGEALEQYKSETKLSGYSCN